MIENVWLVFVDHGVAFDHDVHMVGVYATQEDAQAKADVEAADRNVDATFVEEWPVLSQDSPATSSPRTGSDVA